MNRCKDCKFWKTRGMAYSHTETQTVCDNEVSGPNQHEVYAESLDDTGMETALVTGPEFGCVNFEQRA